MQSGWIHSHGFVRAMGNGGIIIVIKIEKSVVAMNCFWTNEHELTVQSSVLARFRNISFIVFEVLIKNHYLLSKRVIVLEMFPIQLLVFDDCYHSPCDPASPASHRRCGAISIFFQGVSSNGEWLPRAAPLLLWASRLQRVKPFIPLCSSSSQHPTRAKYSCCRRSMLLGAGVLHAWQHRFPPAPWRLLGVHKKLEPLVVFPCRFSPLRLCHSPLWPSPRSSFPPHRQQWIVLGFCAMESCWDRLNCIWPYFCSGHFDLAKSRLAGEI